MAEQLISTIYARLMWVADVVLFALWIGLGIGWFSCITYIARLIGGYEWIRSTGMALPVVMLGLTGILCVTSGFSFLLIKRIPKSVALAVMGLAGVHLLNAIYFCTLSTKNPIIEVFMTPFALLASIVPTSTSFIGMPLGNESVLILPICTFIIYFTSIALGRIHVHQQKTRIV